MKKTFGEYYRVDDKDIKKIWKDGIIVLDTNILLNLYRYSKDTSDDVLNVLKSLKDRLWLPYQVCYEFHSNRLETYYESWNAAESIKKKLNEYITNFTSYVKDQYSRNPFVKIEELDKVVEKSVKKIYAKLDEWRTTVRDFVNDDEILDEITSIFEGRVGLDFNEEKLRAIYKEGEARYKVKCPPGFKDDTPAKRSAGNRHVYGDLILWKQLIEYAKNKKKDVIFISDDQKEDWWVDWKGAKIYPQPALIREFEKETEGKRILFYNQKQFLKYSQEQLNNNTKESTIKEIEAVTSAQIDWASFLADKKMYYGGGMPLYLSGISHNNNDAIEEYKALTGTYPYSLSGIAASQEIIQSALHISELAKPFAGLSKTPEGWIWTAPTTPIAANSPQYPLPYMVSSPSNPQVNPSIINKVEDPVTKELVNTTAIGNEDISNVIKKGDDKSSQK